MTPAPSLTCPRCAMPGTAAGLCPACLLEGVLAGPAWTGPEPMEAPDSTLPRCGPWQLLEVIGRGGTGVVYRARQEGLSRPVAIKILSHTAGPEEWRRFRTEAEAVTSLEHPHIIPVHASGETDGRPWLAMRLAEKGALSDLLNPRQPIPPREAAALVEKIARAVQFAHERGILHRDLKPANILLDAEGNPMVSDFGLARLVHGPSTGTLTGFAVGTPAYMPPEQADGGTITTASDVYSLGAILYHTLTGRPPFSGPMALNVMQDVLTREPVDPRQWQPGLDRDLTVICQKAMDKNPARRYRSAAALADDLGRWLRGESVLARPAGLQERTWKWARRHPALAAAFLLGLLGAAAFVTVLTTASVLLKQERDEVKRQETEARAQTRRAESTGEALRLQAYAADVALAGRALDEGNLGAARRLLDHWQPAAGQPDVRGFEWHHLQQECQGDELAVLLHHQAPVLSAAWSPDGKWLASGGRAGRLVISRASDGSAVRTLPDAGPAGSLTELAWLARLPLASPETATLLATGAVPPAEMLMRSRPSNIGEITSLAWSPDGKWLVTASSGAFVRIWSTSDWTIHGILPVKAVVQVAFSPDGQHLVLALIGPQGSRYQGEIRAYRFPPLSRSLTLPGQAACFGMSRTRPWLATASADGGITLHDVGSGSVLANWSPGLAGISGLALAADGSRLAVIHPHGLLIADAVKGTARHFLPTPPNTLRAVAAAPSGKWFAVAGTDQSITLADGQTGQTQPARRGHGDEIHALSFSPDSQRLASAGNDHSLRLWDVTGLPRRSPEMVAETASLAAVSPDGNYLLGETKDGRVLVRRWPDGAPSLTPEGPVRKALGHVTENGRFATLQLASGQLEWWDATARPAAPPVTLEGAVLPIKSFAVCPAKGWILTSSDRAAVLVRNWSNGQILHRLTPPGPVSRLVISPDGSQLGVLTWPRTLHLADPVSGVWQEPLRLGSGTVGPIQFSPDSRLLVSGGDDNLVTVREARSGAVLATLKSHLAAVTHLAFSQDGRTLASAAQDRSVRLWHVPTWRELGPIRRGTLDGSLTFTARGLFLEEYQTRWLRLPGGS